MKRQNITLIVCGVLLAAVCAGAGWFLFTAVAAKNVAAEARNQAYEELQKIYRAKVFPSNENITRVIEDQKTLEAWLATASNLVHKGDLVVEKKTPTSFKQTLTATVRKLSAQPGTRQGKVVAPDFNFGFDQYLGQSDSLPSSEHVDRLTVQLEIIEKICTELYGANILELKSVAREVFDSADKPGGDEQSSESSRPRRRGDRDRSSDSPTAKPAVADSSYFSKQRFTFEFQARPEGLIEALNRLAKMELFTVVAGAEISKSADPLAAYNTKKSGKADTKAAAEAVDLTEVPHAQRIVTDSQREPPVNVKLDIDVYSFEGV
ncbi:MAG: Amuc_1100 family pilus-like protein [Verrucomicrobiota bacterium]|jgi:hypothetical protein|nr:Amuc_1100 family pilus-like protein [Verrucomicrobiota bacterium]